MLKIGDYVALKPNLVLGKKYGTVTFGKYHVPYLHKLLRVYKVSSTATAYCNHNGYPCDCSTFSESMLDIARFNVDDTVKIVYSINSEQDSYIGAVTTVKSVEYKEGVFIYRLDCDCGFYAWDECTLELCTKVDKDLEDLKPVLENENQLSREDSYISGGERVKGSRVHGWIGKASIRSRPLRNAESVRGK